MIRKSTLIARRQGLLLMMLGALLLPGSAGAATSGALAGTTSVVIEIDGVDEELAAYGLSRANLVQDMTARLQQAGIEVVPGAELGRDGAAVLRFRVRLMRTLYFFYLYNVNLTLNSKVAVEGDGAWTTIATWSEGWTGSMQPTDVGLIAKYAGDLTEQFLAARSRETR